MHLVNGEPATEISLLDRGLLYGHSVFETVRVFQRQPVLLEAHLKRLELGCKRLFLPLDVAALRNDVQTLCKEHSEADFVLRICQTIGLGGRGYQSPERPAGSRIVSAYSLPSYPVNYWQEGVTLGQVEIRLARQTALAGIKHSNRLEQLIARQQWQNDWQEALLLDDQDNVIEGTQSNLFIWHENTLKTPDLSACGVAGVMRETMLKLASNVLGMKVQIMPLSLTDVMRADEVCLTNSVIGLWPVKWFAKRVYTDHSISQKLLASLIKHAAIPPL